MSETERVRKRFVRRGVVGMCSRPMNERYHPIPSTLQIINKRPTNNTQCHLHGTASFLCERACGCVGSSNTDYVVVRLCGFAKEASIIELAYTHHIYFIKFVVVGFFFHFCSTRLFATQFLKNGLRVACASGVAVAAYVPTEERKGRRDRAR